MHFALFELVTKELNFLVLDSYFIHQLRNLS